MPNFNDYQKTGEIKFNNRRGFNRLDPDHMGVPSYTETTRTFTLTPNNTYLEFWAGGKYYNKTTAQSVVWPDVSGTYYFYFDTDGTLQYVLNGDMTSAIFLVSAICGLVYYNKTANVADGAKDEQHGVVGGGGFEPSNHFNQHLTQHFKWAQGGLITGLANGSDEYTNIGVGVHFDEDIINVNTIITSTPFYYRLGASVGDGDGEWTKTDSDLKISHIKSGDTKVCYNAVDGAGTIGLVTTSSTDDFVIMMMAKFNFAEDPYRKIIGTKTYGTRAAAKLGLANDLKAISLKGLSSSEAEYQFAWVSDKNGNLIQDNNGNLYRDLRGININAF